MRGICLKCVVLWLAYGSWANLVGAALHPKAAPVLTVTPTSRARSTVQSSPIPQTTPTIQATPTTLPTPALKAESAELQDMTFDHFEGGQVFFKTSDGRVSSKSLKTGLYDLNFLGTIHAEKSGQPYFLFTGRTSRDGLEDKAVYALRPAGGKPSAFVYPGHILDSQHRDLVFDSRLFYGKCLKNQGEGVFIFQREKLRKQKFLQPSVFIAIAGEEYFYELLVEHTRRMPSVASVLKQVKAKVCFEVDPRHRVMIGEPFKLHPMIDSDGFEPEDDEP